MAAKTTEAVIRDVITKLNTNWASTIASINADHSDGNNLTTPFDVVLGLRTEPGGWPFIMVFCESAQPAINDNGEGDMGGQIHYEYEVGVLLEYADSSEERTQVLTLRYQRAIKEALLASPKRKLLSDTNAYYILWDRDDLSVMSDDRKKTGFYFQQAICRFRLAGFQTI